MVCLTVLVGLDDVEKEQRGTLVVDLSRHCAPRWKKEDGGVSLRRTMPENGKKGDFSFGLEWWSFLGFTRRLQAARRFGTKTARNITLYRYIDPD